MEDIHRDNLSIKFDMQTFCQKDRKRNFLDKIFIEKKKNRRSLIVWMVGLSLKKASTVNLVLKDLGRSLLEAANHVI